MDKNEFSTVNDCRMLTHYDIAELRRQVASEIGKAWNIGKCMGEYEHIIDRLKEVEATLKRLHIDIDSMWPSKNDETTAADNAMTWLLEAIENVIRAKDNIKEAYSQAHKSDTDVRRNIDHIMHNIAGI